MVLLGTRSTGHLCNNFVTSVDTARRASLASLHVLLTGNESRRARGIRRGCGARRRAQRIRVGLAGRGRGPARVLARRQRIRSRPAPWPRHRGRRISGRARPGVGRSDVRGSGTDTRSDRHDRDRGRAQGLADAPRVAHRRPRRAHRRGGSRRSARVVGRGGARRAVRASRRPRRRGREVRRSRKAPPIANRTGSTSGAVATTGATSGSRTGSGSGACPDSGAHPGSEPRAQPCPATWAAGSARRRGSRTCSGSRTRTGARAGAVADAHAGARTDARDAAGNPGRVVPDRAVPGSGRDLARSPRATDSRRRSSRAHSGRDRVTAPGDAFEQAVIDRRTQHRATDRPGRLVADDRTSAAPERGARLALVSNRSPDGRRRGTSLFRHSRAGLDRRRRRRAWQAVRADGIREAPCRPGARRVVVVDRRRSRATRARSTARLAGPARIAQHPEARAGTK